MALYRTQRARAEGKPSSHGQIIANGHSDEKRISSSSCTIHRFRTRLFIADHGLIKRSLWKFSECRIVFPLAIAAYRIAFMGRSTPVRRLSCSRCRKRDFFRVRTEEASTGLYFPTWFNVVVIGSTADGRRVQCKCVNCGHEYKSTSIAAHRALYVLNRKTKSLKRTEGI
mgnify:CR=1 FL=1